MSDWQLWFFLVFLAIQIIYPLFRFAKFIWRPKQSNLYGDYFWYFSWTMKLKAGVGYIDIRVFDRDTDETILRSSPEQIVPLKQYQSMVTFPTLSIQYAKYLEKKFQLPEKNYGLNFHTLSDYNNRGAKKMIDESVDFTREKIKYFGTYHWYLDD